MRSLCPLQANATELSLYMLLIQLIIAISDSQEKRKIVRESGKIKIKENGLKFEIVRTVHEHILSILLISLMRPVIWMQAKQCYLGFVFSLLIYQSSLQQYMRVGY